MTVTDWTDLLNQGALVDDSGADHAADEIRGLRLRVASLEDETVELRRRLQVTPRKIAELEQLLEHAREQLREEGERLEQSEGRNKKLDYTLREAREHIATLRDEVDKLTQPPSGYGTVVAVNADGTVDVHAGGRKMRVCVHPDLEGTIEAGQEVALNDSFNVVLARPPDRTGEIATIKELLDDGQRVLIIGRADEERVVDLGKAAQSQPMRSGDTVLVDLRAEMVLERLHRPQVQDLVLEEVPDVSYRDVGGLDSQIEQIIDAVELPFVHQALFADYSLPAPKGILLYGPPGCGKTLIAKAVANSLAGKVGEVSGDREARSFFLNIKGPELLNKYVGETERQIRLVFQRAREKSEEGWPVIVFFDEMESLFRTRGSGISSDIESTIVPQLLAEIDGVEALRNVIVIGASNREDLIDPAILRPGRLDVKIKIERPDADAAVSIYSRYLTSGLPIDAETVETAGGGDPDKAVQAMIEETVRDMYGTHDDNRFLEVTYVSGDKETMYFKEFSSGAMIENIVRRAKKLAIKREIDGGSRGIRTADLLASIRQEFKEHEDLPNTTNPDDWAKISGKKGERIVYVRTLIGNDDEPGTGGKSIDSVATGQYL